MMERDFTEVLRAADTSKSTRLSDTLPQKFHAFPFEGQRESTIFVISLDFAQAVSVTATDRASTAVTDAIARHSLQIALTHDRMDVFTDPNAAEMLGHVLDNRTVSFEQIMHRIKGPDDVRSLVRIARARLLRETMDGVAAESVAFRMAKQVLENAGLRP